MTTMTTSQPQRLSIQIGTVAMRSMIAFIGGAAATRLGQLKVTLSWLSAPTSTAASILTITIPWNILTITMP
jgi:hypothetical protein